MSIASPIPREWRLLLTVLALAVLAVTGPHVEQLARYHAFADQGTWHGVPHPLDVLSNVAFLVVGAACLATLRRAWTALTDVERRLLALVGTGLLVTGAVSGWYHLAPDDARVALDRAGMVLAFAGLLGLAACRVSSRGGLGLAATVLLAGPLAIVHGSVTGDLWPWVVVQGGGAVLLVLLSATPHPAALPVRWSTVAGLYAAAKALELADHFVWSLTSELLSGHALKHVVAAMAVLPVVAAVAALAPTGQNAAKLPARAA